MLSELDTEKNAELARYKRRLNKLKGQLNVLVTKFTEKDSADARLNNDLTEDYRSLTLKYKDLQAKFRHFEIADTTKYDEVWTMHEEEVKDLVDQLLKADKIISEQQLGWKWKAPDIHALQHVLGRHGGLGLGPEVTTTADSAANASTAGQVDENGAPIEVTAAMVEAEAELKRIAGTRVRAVLKMLATEAGFMINPQVVQSLESLPEDEAEISRAETMLKALGVKSEERLNTLVNYFFREKLDANAFDDDDEEYENELLLLTNAPDEVAQLKDMIKPEDVIAAVKAYIEDISVETGPAVGVGGVGGSKATQEEIRIAQKRLASMRNYWVQLSQVVHDDTVNVWHQLESDCQMVRELLSKRANSIAEVDSLTRQNAELKSLLNQYLGDAVTNSAFKVPPAHVMKVRETTANGKLSPSRTSKKGFSKTK